MEKKLLSVMEILSPTTEDHIDLSNEEVLLEACTSCGEMFDKNNEAAHRATITHQLSIQSEDDNYFEEMKNLLIHNCIGSHTNFYLTN